MTGPGHGELAVQALGLRRRFGSVVAVERVDLEIQRGEVFGLLGPNGAGKTTTLRMLCGLLPPSSGSARVAGIDVWSEPLRARTQLGYLDEEPIVYPYLTGREFLELVADLYGIPRGTRREAQIERLFSLFEIGDKSDELISVYSHGTRQKIAADVAFAVLSGGAVLLVAVSRMLPSGPGRLLALAAVLPAAAAAGIVATVLAYGTRRLARWTPLEG